MITDSYKLWQALQKQAGLDIKIFSDGASYDVDIVEDLKGVLFPGAHGDFDALLRNGRDRISTTDLIYAFFGSVQPFVQMHSDLLLMLTEAGVQHTDDGLMIEFDFYQEDKLKLLLEQFKEQVAVFSEVPISRPFRKWSASSLWNLPDVGKPGRDISAKAEQETSGPSNLSQWISEFETSQELKEIPSMDSHVADEPVQSRVSQAIDLVNEFLRACRRHGRSHSELQEVASAMDEDFSEPLSEFGLAEAHVRHLWQIESDFWPRAMVQWAYDTLSQLAEGKLDTDKFCSEFDNALPSITGHRTEMELRQLLDEILNLPIWKKRHEVYAAWVGSQIWRAMSDWNCIFHPVGGVLSFSFSGVHLATFIDPSSNRTLAFWTELRTPAINLPSGKRKGAIQPDYRLQAAPYSAKETDVAIVEVKQYRKSSAVNFSAAVNDYAHACRGAEIHLVNYGPILESVEGSVLEEFKTRTKLTAFLRPDRSHVCEKFREQIRSCISPDDLGHRQLSIYRKEGGKVVQEPFDIVLTWGATPCDLDLAVHFTPDESDKPNLVNFQRDRYGDLVVYGGDIQNGFGPERVSVNADSGKISVYVHCYSEPAGVFDFNAEIKINTTIGEEIFKIGSVGQGDIRDRIWHVCNIDLSSGILSEIDEVSAIHL